MEQNPYAPPTATVADPPLVNHGLKRRRVIVMIAFMLVSLGVYYLVWWFRPPPGIEPAQFLQEAAPLADDEGRLTQFAPVAAVPAPPVDARRKTDMRLKLIVVAALLVIAASVSSSQNPAAAPPVAAHTLKGPLQAAAELAGFFAAHAVWSISDGETLIPIAGHESADRKRQMKRLITERIEGGAALGMQWLAKNPDGAARAVLIHDGYITVKGNKTDALLLTIRDYAQGDAEITMAVPYRPARDAKGFAVRRPTFLGFKGSEPDWQEIGTAFWAGIAQHEKGATVWNKHLDEGR